MSESSRPVVVLSVAVVTSVVAGLADSIALLVASLVHGRSMLDYLTSTVGITLTALSIGPWILLYVVPMRWWSGRP